MYDFMSIIDNTIDYLSFELVFDMIIVIGLLSFVLFFVSFVLLYMDNTKNGFGYSILSTMIIFILTKDNPIINVCLADNSIDNGSDNIRMSCVRLIHDCTIVHYFCATMMRYEFFVTDESYVDRVYGMQ